MHIIKKVKKACVFPYNIVKSSRVKLDYVYNLVLESGHYCVINGIKVVTLGHNFTSNDVIKHNYYGSDKVIKDLMKFDGWEDGLIILDRPKFERSSDGKVSKLSC